MVDLELYDALSQEPEGTIINCKFYLDSRKCPSYTLVHNKGKDLRRMDISLLGIFTTSDNLHEQLDLFLKHCKRHLQSIIFPKFASNNVKIFT